MDHQVESEQVSVVVFHGRSSKVGTGSFFRIFLHEEKKSSANGPYNPATFHFSAVVRIH